MKQKPKLSDQVRAAPRVRHLSFGTENAYHNFNQAFY